MNSVVQLAGRNLIMNGQGRINQRAYASGTATVAANQYTLDRWRVVTSGQSLLYIGSAARRSMTAPAGGVEQVIGGLNVVGGTYTMNWTGTATCTVAGVARTKGEVFTLTAATDTTVRFIGGTFTDVQLEAGSIRTAYSWAPYSEELAVCQRYFQSLFMVVNPIATFYTVSLPVEMVANPTITGGGAGFTNNSPNNKTLGVYQTTRAGETLSLDAEL
jgi:hypothetical protein